MRSAPVGTILLARLSYWYGMGPQGAEGRAHPASQARNRCTRRGSATRRRVVRTRRGTRCGSVARDRFCHVGNPQPNAPNNRTPGDLARGTPWVGDTEGHGCRQGGTPPRRTIDAPDKETPRKQRSVGLTLTHVAEADQPRWSTAARHGDRLQREPEHASRLRLAGRNGEPIDGRLPWDSIRALFGFIDRASRSHLETRRIIQTLRSHRPSRSRLGRSSRPCPRARPRRPRRWRPARSLASMSWQKRQACKPRRCKPRNGPVGSPDLSGILDRFSTALSTLVRDGTNDLDASFLPERWRDETDDLCHHCSVLCRLRCRGAIRGESGT
jgi:hypothetical protein